MCSEKQECHLPWHSWCPCIVNQDQERGVIQLAVNVRNVLTLSVVMACTGIKLHMRTVLVKK